MKDFATDHVVGALLSMPTTPTLQASSHPPTPSNSSTGGNGFNGGGGGGWNDEDVDIFDILLNEMDSSTPRPVMTTGGGGASTPLHFNLNGNSSIAVASSASSNQQLSLTPSSSSAAQDMSDMTTAFTWADALNSEALMHSAGSFYFDSSAAASAMTPGGEMPKTPTIAASSFSSSTKSSRKKHSSPPPPAPMPFSNPVPTSSSSSSSAAVAAAAAAAASSVLSGMNKTKPAVSKPKKTSPPPPPPLSTSYSKNKKTSSIKTTAVEEDDLEEEDEDEDSNLDDADSSKLSPRSHAIREKNREAVRKCRQKKREREDALNERIRLLDSENEEIRVQLRLGSEDRIREMETETNRRAKRLEDLVAMSDASNSDDSAIDEELREACTSYISHSQERAEDRSAALSGALSRVSRLIDPTLFAKFYLWHGTAKDDYFTNPHGLWASISAEMNVSAEQTHKLSQRREKLERLRAQIMDVSAKLMELQTNVSLKEKVDVDGVFQKSVQALMTPRQLAKFILWIRKDPAVQQVTNSSHMLSSFLDQVTEPPSLGDFAHVSRARDEAAEAAAQQSKKSRLELARERIIILTKGLWDAPKETLESIANQGLTPNVTLIDPNNGGEYHGINKTLQYVHRIRLAFGEKITVDLREMSIDKDKARATWVLQGTYRGRLGAPANSSSAEQKHLKHVSFVIVCTYTFQPNSTLIQEMLVAWDAIGLMRQIGLLKNSAASAARESMAPPPKRSKPATMRFEDIQARRMSHVSALAEMFSASSYEDMVLRAKDILHSGCVFQDSYMGFEFRGWDACAKYAQKVRSPFPTLAVTGVKTSENEGAALGSPLRLDWTIRAQYSGPLVPQVTDCSFNAVLFVTFDDAEHTIDSVHFSWNAQRLMDQLGIMRKN